MIAYIRETIKALNEWHAQAAYRQQIIPEVTAYRDDHRNLSMREALVAWAIAQGEDPDQVGHRVDRGRAFVEKYGEDIDAGLEQALIDLAISEPVIAYAIKIILGEVEDPDDPFVTRMIAFVRQEFLSPSPPLSPLLSSSQGVASVV